ncbi:hypothetical protein [Virgibacillus sp. SK37]|uniref:hypothetical protein n=1 Tax=Virgibacillus sp. SK37 TaxID=403957 RepID=UPI0004D18FA5|nr:hypothetical protein [Virgibacillus sp. SK37]AIF45654.1 hypothetical protein X953_18875 [Virgibacillus sp. SK37]
MAKKVNFNDIEEVKKLPKKSPKRRVAAMAVYMANPHLSVEKVAQLLEWPYGTLNDWAAQDGWKKERDELFEDIKKNVREEIKNEFSYQLYKVASTLLERILESVLSPNMQINDIRELKVAMDTLKENIKIMSTTQLIDEPTTKHEHSLEVVDKADVLRVLMEEENNEEE